MARQLSSPRRQGRRRRGRAPMAEINVTPLVDVMLVLLIIFMVTAPLLVAGVPIDLPRSRADALAEQADQIAISIDRQGAVFMDGERVPSIVLPPRLAALRCATFAKPPLITVRADRALEYGRVMAIMGELNRAGCNSVSLVTSSSGVTAGSSPAF